MLDIKELFPVPVGIVENENIDKSEHKLLLDAEYRSISGNGTTSFLGSTSQHILDKLDIPNTKEFIETALKEYAIRTLCTEEPLLITNSWCIKYQNTPGDILSKVLHSQNIP